MSFVAPPERYHRQRLLDLYATAHSIIYVVMVGIRRALCRGMKAYFDIKDAECREYVPVLSAEQTEQLARIANPAIVPTGDPMHANVYAVYLVHEKAALNSLLNEPRYLSMSPDVAKVDLNAEETSERVRRLCAAAIAQAGATNVEQVSILTVVSTITAPSFVPVPVLYTKVC